MSLGCININTPEFAKLQKATNLDIYSLSAKIKSWQAANNRELDELPTADELKTTIPDYLFTDVDSDPFSVYEKIDINEYIKDPKKYYFEIKRISNLIENKLKFKAKAYVSKNLPKQVDKVDYLKSIFHEITNDIGVGFPDVRTIQQLKNKLSKTDEVQEYFEDMIAYNEDIRDKAKSPYEESYIRKQLLEGFLRNYEKVSIDQYSEEQQLEIMNAFPALIDLKTSKFKSEKQALGYYKANAKKIISKKSGHKDASITFHSANSALRKYETLLNYLLISPKDFSERIGNVVENEMKRRDAFFESDKVQADVIRKKEMKAERDAFLNKEQDFKNVLNAILESKESENVQLDRPLKELALIFKSHTKTMDAILPSSRVKSMRFMFGGNWSDGRITINKNPRAVDSYKMQHTILHEMVHHFSVPYLRKFMFDTEYDLNFYAEHPERLAKDVIGVEIGELDPSEQVYIVDSLTKDEIKNIKKIENIYKHVVKLHKEGKIQFDNYNGIIGNNEYGLTDIYEFVAEALTNPFFAEQLAKLPPMYNKKSTLLRDILDAVLGIFGFTNPSLLEDVYALFEETFLGKDEKYIFGPLGLQKEKDEEAKKQLKERFRRKADDPFATYEKLSSPVGKPIKAFRTSRTKSGQKEYDLDKKPKGKSTETELIIDPSRTLDITQSQETGVPNNDMLIYEQILREAKYEYDYISSKTFEKLPYKSYEQNIGAIVAKKALEKGYEGIIQYKDPYTNVKAMQDKGRKYTKFGAIDPDQIDLDDAKQWLEARGLPFDMAKQTIEIAKGIPFGHEGLFKDGVIYLSQFGTKGAEYHEAFHAVFRMFLTDEQQDAIIAESKKQQPISKEELDELEQAGYFKIADDGTIIKMVDLTKKQIEQYSLREISRKELERLVIEERLAEQFRSYVISNQKVKSTSQKIQKFFSDLWKYIKYYLSNKTTIDKLFFNIEKNRINKKNLNMRFVAKGSIPSLVRNKSVMNHAFKGLDNIDDIVSAINSKFLADYKTEVAKGKEKQFDPTEEYEKIKNIIKLEHLFIDSADKGNIEKNIKFDEYFDTDEEALEYVDEYIDNIKKFLNNKGDIIDNEGLENYLESEDLAWYNDGSFEMLKAIIFWNDAKANYGNIVDRGILYRAKNNLLAYGYKLYGDVMVQDEDLEEGERIYEKSHLEENRKDTLSKEIKEFFTYIPILDENNDPVTTRFDTYKYLKFNDAYTETLTTIINAIGFNEKDGAVIDDLIKNREKQQTMLQMLQAKGQIFPSIRYVAEALKKKYDEAVRTKDFSFIAKFYSSMAMTYNDFVGAIEEVNYVEVDGKMVKELLIKYFDVNGNKIEKQLAKKWEANAKRQDNKGLYVKGPDGSYILNEKVAMDIETNVSELDLFNVRRDRVDDGIINSLHAVISGLGIEISKDNLQNAFENGIIIKNRTLQGNQLMSFILGTSSLNDHRIRTTEAILKTLNKNRDGNFADFYDNYGNEIIKNRFARIGAYFEKSSLSAFTNGENKIIWPINMHTTFSRIVNGIKNFKKDSGATSFWNEWVRDFKKDVFYSPSTAMPEELRKLTGSNSAQFDSPFIWAMFNSTQFNEGLQSMTFDVIKRKHEIVSKNTFSNLSPVLSLIHRINSFGKNGSEGFMNIVMPTLSDRARMLMLSVPRMSVYKKLNNFNAYGNVEIYSKERDEYPVMMAYLVQDLLSAKRSKNISTKIANYLDGKNDNVRKFRQLTFLNSVPAAKKLMDYVLADDQSLVSPDEVAALRDEVAAAITNYINNEVNKKLKEYKKALVTKKTTNIDARTIKMYQKVLKKETGAESVSTEKAIDALIKDYVITNMVTTNELRKIFAADPAFYKNASKDESLLSVFENFNKRFGGIATPGLETMIAEEEGAYGDTPTYTIGIINDIFRKDPKNLEALEKIAGQEAVAAYKDGSNVADAMGLVTIEKYRRTAMGMGMWTMGKDGHEDAYKNYKKTGKFVTKSGKKIKLVPLKTYHDGMYLKEIDGVPIMMRILVKHSTIPLLKEFTETSPMFDAIRKHMESDKGFDELNMDSAIKSGLHNNIDLKIKDGVPVNLDEIVPIELNTRFKRSPQLIPDRARESTLGSQLMKLSIANMEKHFDKDYVIGTTESGQPSVLKGKEIFDKYHEIIGLQLNNGMRDTFDPFNLPYNENGNPQFESFKKGEEALDRLQKLRSMLINSVEERELPDTYSKALNIIKTEDGYDYESPLAMPAFSKMFERMLLSISKNGFMKIPVYGKGLVQIAEIGEVVYTDENVVNNKRPLKFLQGEEIEVDATKVNRVEKEDGVYYDQIMEYDGKYYTQKRKKGKKVVLQRILSAEIAIPFKLAEAMKLPRNPDGSFDLSNIPEDVLELLGYRIPTQGKNSILPLKIAHVLPESMGKQVMVPAEITTQMGSDFDIDKLFTILPHLKVTATYTKKNKEGIMETVEWNEFGGFKSKLEKLLPKNVKLTNHQIGNLLEDTEYADELTIYSRNKRLGIRSAVVKAKKHQSKIKERLRNVSVEKVKYDINNLQNASKQELDNAMFDMIKAVMLSPYHTKEILSVIDNPLVPNLGELFKKTKEEYTDYIEMQDNDTEMILERRNKAAKSGIGIWATATTGHAGRQYLKNAVLTQSYSFDGMAYDKINIVEDSNGNDISYQLQQHLTSAVDNANDPNMEYLNDNGVTSNVRNLMISLGFYSDKFEGKYVKERLLKNGVDISTIDPKIWKDINGSAITASAFFLNQPVINYFVERYVNEEGTPGKMRSIAYDVINEKFRSVSGRVDEEDTTFPINPDELLDDFNKDLENMSDDFALRQLKVLLNFIDMSQVGGNVSRLNKVINSDRIKEFTSMSGIEKHLDLVDEVISNETFENAESGEILKGFPISEHFIRMIEIANDFSGQFLPFNKFGLKIAKHDIAHALGRDVLSLNTDTLELINASSYMHLISQKKNQSFPESPFAPLFSKQWEYELLKGPNNISIQWRNLKDAIEDSELSDPIRRLVEEGTIENAFFSTIDDHEDNSKITKIDKRGKKGKKSTQQQAGVNLGTETAPAGGNVVIDTVKGKKPQAGAVVAYRTKGKTEQNMIDALEDNAVGNPFGPYAAIYAKADGTAVTRFLNWLEGTGDTTVMQDYRNALLAKVPELKGKTIYYYKDLGRPSHATALDYFLNKATTQQAEEVKFKDTFEHKILSYNSPKDADKNRESDGFSAMLNHEDPRVRKFTKMLVYYQILSQGFSKSPNSFADVISNEVWNNPDLSLQTESKQSLNDYIRENIEDLYNDSMFWSSTGFTLSFLTHVSAVRGVLPSPSIKNSAKWVNSIKKQGQYFANENDPIVRDGIFPKMVKVYDVNTKEYMLLFKNDVKSRPTKAVYELFKPTNGKINETWKFQNFNVDKSLSDVHLTPEQFNELEDSKICKK